MATSEYSHKYTIERGGVVYKGDLQLEENIAFAISYETNLDSLSSTEQAAITTFLTAVDTLNTALGNIDDIHITLKSTDKKGKVDLTY